MALAAVLLSSNLGFAAESCKCGEEKHEREERAEWREGAKSRGPGEVKKARVVTIAEMSGWQIPQVLENEKGAAYAQEKQPVAVEGHLRAVWVNGGDCDMRMELADAATSGGKALQIEIPNTKAYCGIRAKLEKELKGHGIDVETTRPASMLERAPLVKVTGWPMLGRSRQRGATDSAGGSAGAGNYSHAGSRDQKTTASTKSSPDDGAAAPQYSRRWEIHPAFQVEFVKQ